MWAGFFCRQDVSISIFGRTKEFSEVRGTSLMCNFGVRSRFLDVIYGVRPPNGSPGGFLFRNNNADVQAGLCLCSQTPKDRFSQVEAHLTMLYLIGINHFVN